MTTYGWGGPRNGNDFPRHQLVEQQERLDVRQLLQKKDGGGRPAADRVEVGGSGIALGLVKRVGGWWFECPKCQRAARIVYPAFGFVCVRCTPCDYLCRHDHDGHPAARLAKLRAELGAGPALMDELPRRARGKWRKKYLRQRVAIDRLERQMVKALDAFTVRARKTVKRRGWGKPEP